MKPFTKTIIVILVLITLGITFVISPSSIRKVKLAEILGIQVVEKKADPLPVPARTEDEKKDKLIQAKADLNFASSGGIRKGGRRIDEDFDPTPIPRQTQLEIKKEVLNSEIDTEKQIENQVVAEDTVQPTPTPEPSPTSITTPTPTPNITQIPEKSGDNSIQSSYLDMDIEVISEEEAEDFRKTGKIRRENGVIVPMLLATYSPASVEESVSQGNIFLLIRKKEGNYYRVIPNNGSLLVNPTFIVVTNETKKRISERGIEMNQEDKATYFKPLIRAFQEYIRNWDQGIELLIHVSKPMDIAFARKQNSAAIALESRGGIDISWEKDIVRTHGTLVLKDSNVDYNIEKISIIDPSSRKKTTYSLNQKGSGK